jgi:hypothetical protein
MSFGNNGAGPQGAPIFGNQGPATAPVAAGAVPGQAGAPANGATPFYGAGIESVMAAVSRGEIPLNATVAVGSQFGGNNANAQQGNPTLLQAISQGLPQNGTNGLNGIGAGGGTVNSSMASTGGQPGSFDANTSMGGTQTIDAKQVINTTTGAVSFSSPQQYGGN